MDSDLLGGSIAKVDPLGGSTANLHAYYKQSLIFGIKVEQTGSLMAACVWNE